MKLKQILRIFKKKSKQNVESDMKYLIVGLGNMGAEYVETRHNIGFKVVEAVAESANGTFRSDRYGDLCEIKHRGRTLLLLKPSTYMNLSGNAVRYWMQKSKIEMDNLLVVVDDIALPFGTIRIRKQGSDGGHNGLKHINEILGHQNYARMRFGIGGDFPQGYQIDHVMGKWEKKELEKMPAAIKSAREAILSLPMIGMERTMNLYNTKK